MATDNIALMKRFVDEVWNKGNLNVADELASSGTIFHDPTTKDVNSLDAFKKYVQALRTGFPDLHVNIEDISASGERVLMRWTAAGTNKGPYLGVGATNKRGIVPGMSCNRIEGGKIVEVWMNYDVLGLLQQLGLAPPLGKVTQAAAPPPSAH